MRSLLLPSGVGRSHVQRLILIADALRGADVDVEFGADPHDPDLVAAGYRVHPVPDPTVTDFTANVYGTYDDELIEASVAAERAAIAAAGPDAVISDFRPTAAISCQVEGVPHAVVTNAALTRWFDPVDVLMPGAGGARRSVASRLGRSIQSRQKRKLVERFRKVAARLGTSGLETLDDFFDGEAVLIADVPKLLDLPQLPPRARYIGPLVWDGPYTDASVPPGDQPLVYATIGNTGGEALAQLVMAAFGEDGSYRVVLTTGPYIDPRQWEAPPWIRISAFVSGSEVLSRARVAIHCGGTGTTYQALRAGVPSVVVPFSNEQRINALALKREGAALPLEAALSPVQLRAGVEIVQRPDYATSVARLRQEVMEWDGPGNAAAAVVALADRRR